MCTGIMEPARITFGYSSLPKINRYPIEGGLVQNAGLQGVAYPHLSTPDSSDHIVMPRLDSLIEGEYYPDIMPQPLQPSK